ncbi:MAG: CPBP family intramembrane metalloprotease [Alloprevotella sp.]|nr:CPBP family intramembrane metalloprotease [Alloprevotella sp.]
MKPKTNALLLSAALVALFIAAQVVAGMMAMLWGVWQTAQTGADISPTLLTDNPAWTGVAMVFAYALLGILLWGTGLIRRSLLPKRTPAMPGRWGWGLLAFFAISMAIGFLTDPFSLDDGGSLALFEGMKGNMLCLLLLVVLGPFTEEIVFREGVLRIMKRGGFSSLTAILTSAALFALIHGNLAQAVPAFGLGVLLGYLYVRTGDIRLSLIAHILNNAFAITGLFFPQLDEATSSLSIPASIAIGILLALPGLALFAWSAVRAPKESWDSAVEPSPTLPQP